MKKRILFSTFIITSLIVLGAVGVSTITPVHATTTWPILLDTNSTGNTDANPQATNIVAKTFSLGLILEANSTTPMNGVFGWQVSIIYDNTTVVPQGDPSPASATDEAANTA